MSGVAKQAVKEAAKPCTVATAASAAASGACATPRKFSSTGAAVVWPASQLTANNNETPRSCTWGHNSSGKGVGGIYASKVENIREKATKKKI